MAISAHEQIKQRKREEWSDMLESFLDNPQQMTDHLALGMSLEQRKKAKQIAGKSGFDHYFKL